MYAKLERGALIPAPKMLHIGSNHVWNPTVGQYAAAGYKPVEYTEVPAAPEGFYYNPGWEEQENAIVQTWALVELPPDIPDDEAMAIILGGDGE